MRDNFFYICSVTDERDIISMADQILLQEISDDEGEFKDETIDVNSVTITGGDRPRQSNYILQGPEQFSF